MPSHAYCWLISSSTSTKKVKLSRIKVFGNSNSVVENVMTAEYAARKRSEKYLMKMCIGTTASFAILNLPMAIALCISGHR